MSTFILILFKKQNFHRDKQEEYIRSVPFFSKRKKKPTQCRIRKFFSRLEGKNKNNPRILASIHIDP